MITVTAVVRCITPTCPWHAGPGDWGDVDRAAEAHTRTAKHPTGVTASPAAAKDGPP